MASSDIRAVTAAAQERISALARETVREPFWVTHYGANDLHPRYLVFWICVDTDGERDRLRGDAALMGRLHQALAEVDYPEEGRESVYIGFESQETVDREANGNWWQHWR